MNMEAKLYMSAPEGVEGGNLPFRLMAYIGVILGLSFVVVLVLAVVLAIPGNVTGLSRLSLTGQVIALGLSFLAAFNSQKKVDRETSALAELQRLDADARLKDTKEFVIAKDEKGRVQVITRVTQLDKVLPTVSLLAGVTWVAVNIARTIIAAQ